MKFVLLGAPGAGKGSQAAVMADCYKIPHISTGDVFRTHLKAGTEIGVLAKSYMDKGLLVPDDVVDKIVEQRLAESDCVRGFILDGYPRTIPQAEALSKVTDLDYVVDIVVAKDIVVKRISGRRMCMCGATYNTNSYDSPLCEKCGKQLYQREDDKKETVLKRLEVYEKNTAPLIEYYQKKGLLIQIDGGESVEKTFENLQKALATK